MLRTSFRRPGRCCFLFFWATFTGAQFTRQQLSLNSLVALTVGNLSSPRAFDLPSTEGELSVSIALCGTSLTNNAPFYITNDTKADLGAIFKNGGGDNVMEVQIQDGYGSWKGPARDGAVLAVKSANSNIEIGVSDDGPRHAVLDSPSLLGDTTSNLAIVFSPPLLNASINDPTYPNYTLAPANLSLEAPPPLLHATNMTFVLFPTASSPADRIPRTGCALRASNGTGKLMNETYWQKDTNGWRNEWLIGGLTPATNYTMFSVVNGTKVSRPINLVTKSASFACPLVHKLPFCPGIAYAVPLSAPPAFPLVAHEASTLDNDILGPLLEYMTNFTVTLSTFACGRDLYSPLQTCQNCQDAYRRWLCATQFPRCAESPSSQSQADPDIAPALVVQKANTPQRNPNFPNVTTNTPILLPCLETCQAVDRTCPSFLGFRCPVVKFNAASSYGVGYVDQPGKGKEGGGLAGMPQDEWGNVWCNPG